MSEIKSLLIAFLVDLWILADSFIRWIGLGPQIDELYGKLCQVSSAFDSLYGFFIAAYYRKKYTTYTVRENLVFLDCFWGRKIGGNPYAIYKEILKDSSKSWKFIWVRNKNIPVPKDVEKNPDVVFVEHRSIAYAKALLEAGVLICNSNFLPFFARRSEQIFINTWHGIPIKTLGLDTPQPMMASLNTQRNFNQATLIPMASRWSTEKIVKSYGAGLAGEQVFESGSPRIDLILNANKSSLYEELSVPFGKKIVLYAPTWRGGSIDAVSEDISEQIGVIDHLKSIIPDDYVLYVSLHHLTRKALGNLPVGINCVPDELDICEFLSVVDVLVSDYSSIFIDYLVLDRPIILHVTDYDNYKSERGLLVDISDLPVTVTYKNSELSGAFNELRKPSTFSQYDKYKSLWVPYEDGCSSARCWQEAKERRGVRLCKDRTHILLHGGRLADSGITRSLINLLEAADQEKYKFWVTFPARLGEMGSPGARNVAEIEKYAGVIFLPKESHMTFFEYLSAFFYKHVSFTSPQFLKRILGDHAYYEVRRFVGDFKFDWYVDFSGFSYYWCLLAPYFNADKRIIYLHTDVYEDWKTKPGMEGLSAVVRSYDEYDYLVSVSDACCQENLKKLSPYISDTSKLVGIPNSFNGGKVRELAEVGIEEISPPAKDFLRANQNKPVFITVSRLSPEKNLSLALQALSRLKNSGQNALLIIVGDGDERGQLESEVADLGLEADVFFTGFLANPYPLLRAADCLLLPSKYEGQGLVLLEALTLGKYCIATDHPATREILEGGYGDLVDHSVEALSNALLAYCKTKPVAKDFDYRIYSSNAMQRFDELLLS